MGVGTGPEATSGPKAATRSIAVDHAAAHGSAHGDVGRQRTPRIAGVGLSGVLVVTVRNSKQKTVTVLLPGEATERTVPVGDVVETMRGITKPGTSTGSWYYPFTDGCVACSFDAPRRPRCHA